VAKGLLAGRVAIVPLGDAAADHAPALARRLATEGATVVLVAGADALDRSGRVASDIETAGEGRAAVFALDPADPACLDRLVELVAELFGKGAGG
jgi:NAD(P)-dependent dehydrogenase (short-subunit alcohol dehydrogenase family)